MNLVLVLVLIALALALGSAASGNKVPLWPAVFVICIALIVQALR